jgi:hypothetical protein
MRHRPHNYAYSSARQPRATQYAVRTIPSAALILQVSWAVL